jgi:hypothetical protein
VLAAILAESAGSALTPIGVRTGQPRSGAAGALRDELSDRLDAAMEECGTAGA